MEIGYRSLALLGAGLMLFYLPTEIMGKLLYPKGLDTEVLINNVGYQITVNISAVIDFCITPCLYVVYSIVSSFSDVVLPMPSPQAYIYAIKFATDSCFVLIWLTMQFTHAVFHVLMGMFAIMVSQFLAWHYFRREEILFVIKKGNIFTLGVNYVAPLR